MASSRSLTLNQQVWCQWTQPLIRNIKGLGIAVRQMKEGDSWQVYIPPGIGLQGQQGEEVVPPSSIVFIDVTLLEVNAKYDWE